MEIPSFGLGTYQLKNDICYDVIRQAFKDGYKLIDTATAYGNEETVGRAIDDAIKNKEIKREDIFVTTKLSPKEQGVKAENAILNSLKRLNLDYIDLVLIHWPGTSGLKPNDDNIITNRKLTWQTLSQYKKKGLIRYIGVSNFLPKHLDTLIDLPLNENDPKGEKCPLPYLNQIELHPYNYKAQVDSIDYCKKRNIIIQSYASLGEGELFKENYFIDLLNEYNVNKKRKLNIVELLLLWCLKGHNFYIIPKTCNFNRLKSNIDILTININDDLINLFKRIDNYVLTNDFVVSKFCWDPINVI